MSSEGERGGGTELGALVALLSQSSGGDPPTSTELAELLWLAGHVEAPPGDTAPAATPPPGDTSPATGPPPADRPPPPVPRPPTRPVTPPDPAPAPADPRPPADRPAAHRDRVPLRLPAPGDSGDSGDPHTTLLAPAPPMLPHPLALQRALRPLKRRVPAPVGQELDEEATAHRIARLGTAPRWWLPVLRPSRERWLTLHLVYDTGPTMPVWRPLVRELHAALAQSGVFRTVERHRLAADGTVRRPGSRESYASGRTVVLLVSDCMGPQWRGDGPAGARWYRTLRRWAAGMPVAVLQPLPERLWRTTALPASTARITSPWPAAPNSAYALDSYLTEDLPPQDFHPQNLSSQNPPPQLLPSQLLPLPVLEPSAPWLANWSALVAGSAQLPSSVAMLGPGPPPAPVDGVGRGDVERLSPEELLLRFRSTASPEAFRLAGHLAVGRPELPVMRLIQAAVERNPQPQHLAEVILSGVLSGTGRPPGSYAFRPGVRELLVGTLPRTALSRTSELVSRVGRLIDARAGVTAGEFPVLAPGAGDARAAGEPFAAVREESVRRLGGGTPAPGADELVLGRYRLLRWLGHRRHVMLARDTRLERIVVLYPYTVAPDRLDRFREVARVLAGITHPNVVAVHDHGVQNGSAYLVTEYTQALNVAELTAGGSFLLPFSLLAPLARQAADGLKAVHDQGIAHGRLTPNGLLVCPDGTVKITHFALASSGRDDESRDLRQLGHLVRELAGGELGGELARIPGEFRTRFDDALTPLVSSDTAAQRRGRDLFRGASFTPVLDAAAAHRYRYRLLGPVRISQGGRTLPVGSAREQALLCMLLLHQGRAVPYGELIEGIWGQRPPQRADRLLSTHVTGLRGTLGPGVLATTADGYALYAGPDSVDAHHMEELSVTAEAHRDHGDPSAARDAVRAALGLWDGHPVDGVPGPAAEAARGRLRALRIGLCATRAELDLELGDFATAEADLVELLRSHPQREDFQRLHVLALKGQGRVAEALTFHREYEQGLPEESGPAWRELHEELRTAASWSGRATVALESADPDTDETPHGVLAPVVTRLFSSSGIPQDQYDMFPVAGGYLVFVKPGTSVLSVLHAAQLDIPGGRRGSTDAPRMRLTLWHTEQPPRTALPPDLDHVTADVLIVLSPELHQELTGTAPDAAARFRPVQEQSSTEGQPVAWYCPLERPRNILQPAPEPAGDTGADTDTEADADADTDQPDLIHGPFTTRDPRTIRVPEPGRAAVVHTMPPDNALTLLHPSHPYGKRTSWPLITYYEVDLTTRRTAFEVSLSSSGGGTFAASVELTWRVDDPVAFVRGEPADVRERLLDHFVQEGGRITRRHPLRRAAAAEHAVHEGLRRWPVPGLSVTCAVRLAPEAKPSSTAWARRPTPKRRDRRGP
ncbi:SAV_2336 N-terminal domain-related protein [Streptomyces sp. NPDC127072]|uniref:SAV_2336 N-terminal domain-related protein n=1 Tax=Streptomyces sp. NPDC127072 TaxID=3347129 RepID=UPI00364D7F57